MHSLEGIVKINSDNRALNYATALNLGGNTPDAPKSEEKTGKPHPHGSLWRSMISLEDDSSPPTGGF